jgi:hypothetical protein
MMISLAAAKKITTPQWELKRCLLYCKDRKLIEIPYLPVKFLTNLLSYKFIRPVISDGILRFLHGTMPVREAQIVKFPFGILVLAKISQLLLQVPIRCISH